ncbi:hypothetical protein D9619_011659 [Psilocybe cf. subviscida]|uniref:Histone chaperone domain-containing protein n=1 Tax=Psilocybe cf. subviscida TaxID=2480587 RepID=A0A8H5BSB6_9AGAR|nr:hypothetical protein D9619_011659 [Psilocybe cf. subviscida]
MSTNATNPSATENTQNGGAISNASPSGKGKGKAVEDHPMEEDEEEEDDDEEIGTDEEGEEDEEEVEEEFEEIDPGAIIGGGRRTRGIKVDYTSKEALAKAGLNENENDDDDDEDVEMKA